MATKKLICFDLDGTLLNSQRQISPLNIEVLKSLDQAGHVVSIATGRLYKSACKIRHAVPTKLEIICSNGLLSNPAEKSFAVIKFRPRSLKDCTLWRKIMTSHWPLIHSMRCTTPNWVGPFG